MIKQVYYVEYGAYNGYASTEEEAKKLEEKYKTYTENSGPITSNVRSFDDYMNSLKNSGITATGTTI